ncbi:hypothetical protein Ocin01_01616, partial [Orchesella cincta]
MLQEHAAKKEETQSTTDSTSALLNSSRSLSLDTLSTTSRSKYSPSSLSPTISSTTSTTSDDTSKPKESSQSSTTSSSTPHWTDFAVPKTNFSTPYSSISSEARNRLSRFRDEPKRVSPDTSLSVPSDTPVLRRRRTTDLTDVELEANSSSGDTTPSPPPSETVTIRLRKANSFGETADSGSSPSPPTRVEHETQPPTGKKARNHRRLPHHHRLPDLPHLHHVLHSPTPKVNFSRSAISTPTPPTTVKFPLKKTIKDKDVTETSTPNTTPSPSPTTAATTPPDEAPLKPKKTKKKRLLIQEVKEVTPTAHESTDSSSDLEAESSADVAFIIQ